jgi:pyruvate dehydrogenase E1 component beta subunit
MGERGKRIPLGKAKVVVEGTDATLISYGSTMAVCLAVADKLSKEGIKVEVVDLRSVAPIDNDTIFSSVAKTGRAVVVHESMKTCGVGAEVSSRIHENLFSKLKAPVQRVTSAFCPVPFSKPLEAAFVPSQDQIEAAIRATLK